MGIIGRRTLATLLCAGILAGCGDEATDTGADEEAIREAIGASLSIDDPAECTLYSTQSFLEQTNLERGAAAVESCEQNAGDATDDPSSFEVSDVVVDGTTATASVALEGTTFDRQTIDLALVEEDGRWKLDRMVALPEFDLDRFADAVVELGSAGADGYSPEQAACLGEELCALGAEQVKAALLAGDGTVFEAAAMRCLS